MYFAKIVSQYLYIFFTKFELVRELGRPSVHSTLGLYHIWFLYVLGSMLEMYNAKFRKKGKQSQKSKIENLFFLFGLFLLGVGVKF